MCLCSYDRALKYINERLMERKGKTEKSTIIVEDFNTTLSMID